MALGISGIVLSSDGMTVTFTVTGGIGAISPTSGITGIYIRGTDAASPLQQVQYGPVDGTSTLSGTTVTVHLTGKLHSGVTSPDILMFACNITDTLSNTYTNNATFGFSSAPAPAIASSIVPTNANIGMNCTYADFAQGALSGATNPACRLFGKQASEVVTIDFVLNCTAISDVNILRWGNQAAFSFGVSIDGGSYTTFTPEVNNGSNAIQIATALSIASHAFSIKYISGDIYFFNTTFLQVFGGTATMTQPYSDSASALSFWSMYPPHTVPYVQEAVTKGDKTVNTVFTQECGGSPSGTNQGWLNSTGFMYPPSNISGPSFSFHRATTPTFMSLYSNTTAGLLDIRVDNVSVGQVSFDGTGVMKLVDLTSALSGVTGAHDYVITFVSNPGTAGYICSVIVSGGNFGTPPASRPLAYFGGDSRVAGNGVNSQYGNTFGPLHGIPYQTANKLLDGVHGTAYLGYGIAGGTYGNKVEASGFSIDYQINTTNVVLGNNQGFSYGILYGAINDARQLQGSRPHTTTSGSVSAGSAVSIPVGSTAGFIDGNSYWIDVGGPDPINSPGVNAEKVVLHITDGTHFSAPTLAHAHGSGVTISGLEVMSVDMQGGFFNCAQTLLLVSGLKLYVVGTGPTNINGNEATYGLTATGSNQVIGYANLNYVNGRLVAALATSGTGNGKGDNTTYLTSGQAGRSTYIDPGPLQLNLAAGSYDVTSNANPPPNPLTPPNSNYTVNYWDGVHENGTGVLIIANAIIAAANPSGHSFRSFGSQFHSRKGSRQLASI